ncbi:TetR family transcriptional regulator [Gordonia alkanivorans CGMCC 6845]|uniref:TetR family transcriptional regulator n=1 Tax=Gordonia alkanivorans CGMCC 6845 TaxID=1423140 RepID=W9D8P4_9ACTN|nr:TetR/AcrR family transcriptional regulator [Gordonia alkanivorans]ETA05678.1 TetR family transcriptional regulator [Gordonia alkanivorans CGMCC 6845]
MRSTGPTFTETARRAQLVECGIETIAELGYAQASVRKIADRAGVAMSVVLYHFGHKDDLVAAIVSECYRTLIEVMLPAVESEETAAGKLAAHIRTHLAYIGTHRDHQLALTEIASNFRGRDGQRLANLDVDPGHLDALARIDLEVIYRQGKADGEFGGAAIGSLALATRSAIGGALLRSTVDPDFDLPAYAQDLIAIFLRAAEPNASS